MFKKVIATRGTARDKQLADLNPPMLPRGSALITSSGNLAHQGINAIIHAATGAMNKQGGIYEPTRDSIVNAIKNSFELLTANSFNKLAIPFIGGKIFLKRIGITAEELAKIIVDSSFEANADGSKFVLVIYGSEDYGIFKKVVDENYPLINPDHVLKEGSITHHEVHRCDVIVNAANMEVQFGGGLSGIIASAAGDFAVIDAEALAAIRQYWNE